MLTTKILDILLETPVNTSIEIKPDSQAVSLLEAKFDFSKISNQKVSKKEDSMIEGYFESPAFGSFTFTRKANKVCFERDNFNGILHNVKDNIWMIEVIENLEMAYFLNTRCLIMRENGFKIDFSDEQLGCKSENQEHLTEFILARDFKKNKVR